MSRKAGSERVGPIRCLGLLAGDEQPCSTPVSFYTRILSLNIVLSVLCLTTVIEDMLG